MFAYEAERRRLGEKIEAESVDALFAGPPAELGYLTEIERTLNSSSTPLLVDP